MSIVQGFKNLIFSTEEIKSIALKRKQICDGCPVSEYGKSKFCKLRHGGCGCYLPAKRKDPEEECPLEKWKAE